MAEIDPQLAKDVKYLCDTIKSRFAQPEFITGCEVVEVSERETYANNNGWVEAICAQHNQQRVRWKSTGIVTVGSYIDVIYFPARKVFESYGLGGTDNISSLGGAWPPPGACKIGAFDYATIVAACAAAVTGDLIKVGEGTFAEDFTLHDGVELIGSGINITNIASSTAGATLTIAGNSSLRDFTINNDTGLGITCAGSGVILNNVNVSGGGAEFTDGNATMTDCNCGDLKLSGSSTIFVFGGEIETLTIGASATLKINSTVLATVSNAGTITDLSNVSRVMQADFQGAALTADATGNLSTAYNVTLTGASKAIAGSGSNFPDIGTTTLAAKFGNIYLGASKDVYPSNDAYPLFARFVNYGFTPDEHWRQNADELSWTGWAAYTGFVTPSSVSRTNSSLRLGHSAANTKAFYYRAAATGGQIALRARASHTYIASAGVMIDDGANNADGNGANNFYRCYMTATALGGVKNLIEQYRVGGGAVTTNTMTQVVPPAQYIGLGFATNGTLWTNWNVSFIIMGEPVQQVVSIAAGGFTWTPARVGLYFANTAADVGRQAIFDWYDEATS